MHTLRQTTEATWNSCWESHGSRHRTQTPQSLPSGRSRAHIFVHVFNTANSMEMLWCPGIHKKTKTNKQKDILQSPFPLLSSFVLLKIFWVSLYLFPPVHTGIILTEGFVTATLISESILQATNHCGHRKVVNISFSEPLTHSPDHCSG